MNNLFLPIIIPFIAGILAILLPKKPAGLHKGSLLVVTFINLILAVNVFLTRPQALSVLWKLDNLSALIVLSIGVFGFLISLYSTKYFSDDFNLKEFSIYTMWTLGAASAVALTNDFVLLLVFWGILGGTLYLLVSLSNEAVSAAKKTFIIIGATDALMILGIAIIWVWRGNLSISGQLLPVRGLNIAAFICLALAALSKAGAIPVHTWVPDVAEKASVPVTALLPAALDKLLGIYLLARIVTDIFAKSAFIMNFLLIIGALTVIIAVMMALIQHDLKRLLGYHAVSQVGYMIIGIGTGNLIGMAGGLFHMLNNTIYKSTLFLCGGSVEKQTGTSDLDQLGGISKLMPITFACTVIASVSISGIPPFNGFVSKWLIYQGLIQSYMSKGSVIALIVLLAAMIGSALTMASFMKLIHAAFLSSPKRPIDKVKEVSAPMWIPVSILSFLCVIFGVFAYKIPLEKLIYPAVTGSSRYLGQTGFWQPGLATTMVLIGSITGLIVYYIFFAKHSVRSDSAFIGGEIIPAENNPSGTDFYLTISNLGIFKPLYKMAEKKYFDIYDVIRSMVFSVGGVFSKLHTGILHTYLAWCLLGILLLFWVLI